VHGPIPSGLAWLRQDGIEFLRGSVTRREDWLHALEGVDCVVHLAAETGTGQSMYDVARYNEVNSQGTALLFDVLCEQPKRTVKRVILTSSRSVYGEGAYVHSDGGGERIYPGSRSAEQLGKQQWEPRCPRTDQPLQAVATKETDHVRPASIYAATKLAQEDLVRVGCESLGLEYAIFRLQNVYGEGQSLKNPYTGILSIFSTRVRHGLVLPLFEDGLESRDFVHVDDVAEVLLRGVSSTQRINDIVNVGTGIATSVRELAIQLSKALGSDPKVTVTGQSRIGDIRHNFADIKRLHECLDYTPRISLIEGLRRFADWVVAEPLPEDLLGKANSELASRNLLKS
jgi:dTDP-L-rhamnose 4-epimerase